MGLRERLHDMSSMNESMNKQMVCTPFSVPYLVTHASLLMPSQTTSSWKTEAEPLFRSSPEHWTHIHSSTQSKCSGQPLNKYSGTPPALSRLAQASRAEQRWLLLSEMPQI